MTVELSQWDRNFLTFSNSALACSPSLLPRLITCLGLSTMTDGLEPWRCTPELRDKVDMVELQDSVEGHWEGGIAEDTLSDLFKSGLSVPESMLECLVWVTGGENEEGGGWGGCLTTSFSWTFSCWAAWDRAWDVQGDSQHFAKMARKCSMRAEVWGKWSQKEPLATSTRDCSKAM